MEFKNIFFVIFLLCGSWLFSQVNFVNQASTLGVNISAGDLEYGSGISFCDFNNDGWDDITIATEGGAQTEFYLNDQDGTFTRQNFTLTDNNVQGRQIIWVDYDNDGDKDLFITSNINGNHLYNNDGNLNLTDVTAIAGLPTANIETWGVSFGDINNDGNLDFFLSNRDDNLVQPNLLFLNDGDGTFTDISISAGIHTTSHLSFCSAFFDYNNDGWQDIYIANDKDFNENFLYHNNGDNTFTNVAAAAGVNIAIDAMTTSIGDYNNDGWFDIYVTNTPTEGNVLFRNNGDGTFENTTEYTGTAMYSFCWGTVFLDADNDTDLDMYVSSSMNGAVPSLISAQFYTNNNEGQFLTTDAGFLGDTGISHSNAIGDVDNDGFPEIIVSNTNDEPIFLWKNQTPQTNNWLKVKLNGVISNQDGIGSRIEISVNGTEQYRYTLCGEGYISQNSNTEFFGLGTNTLVDYVKVTWLSGTIDYLENVNINQLLEITEGAFPLSIQEYTKQQISYYPNPVTDKLTLNSKENIEYLSIYNVLGQKVLSFTPNTLENHIDMSSLQTGTYFVKVNIKNSIQIIKIFKN